MDTEKLLTLQETADALGVSTTTLRRWRKASRPPIHVTVGRKIMYPESAVAAAFLFCIDHIDYETGTVTYRRATPADVWQHLPQPTFSISLTGSESKSGMPEIETAPNADGSFTVTGVHVPLTFGSSNATGIMQADGSVAWDD